MKPTILNSDDTEENFIFAGAFPTLSEMQKAVNGLIEVIYLDDLVMIVNEEGKLMDLPHNTQATQKVKGRLWGGDYVVGDVILMDKKLLK